VDDERRSVSIVELSDTLATAMRNIAPSGPGVCSTCWTFHDPAYENCSGCGFHAGYLDTVVPISYAPRGGQLAAALRGYKDEAVYRVRYHHAMRLAAILWRFLLQHEAHVAMAAGASAFDTVTVVPSKTTAQDEKRPGLRTIVGTVVEPTAGRFQRLLLPTDADEGGRYFDAARYKATQGLEGNSVLLVDDTWVSGSSAQSAAYALREAGATHVACVAIGRWLTRGFGGEWGTAGDLYEALPREYDWNRCALD
jgi:predicted amidophosphoribosyltransferase